MTESLPDILAHAARTGEVIRIVYHGGSQPGTVREIVPLAVTDTEMRAHDFASRKDKRFKLAMIEIPDPAASPPKYDPDLQSPPEEICSLKEMFEGKLRDLEALGWHVQLSEDAIAVHRVFSNGNPRKTPDVRLTYDEFVVDLVDDFDGQGIKEERRKSSRPYHVYSRRFASARSLGKMSTAAALFLDEARGLAPGNAT